MLVEYVLEVRFDRVAKNDGVGNLHHGGFHVQRKQNALSFRIGDLFGKKFVQFAAVHRGCVNDFASKHGDGFFEHGGRSISSDQLNFQVVSGIEGRRLFIGDEIAIGHMSHVGF